MGPHLSRFLVTRRLSKIGAQSRPFLKRRDLNISHKLWRTPGFLKRHRICYIGQALLPLTHPKRRGMKFKKSRRDWTNTTISRRLT
jgi:hypothetical protein